ncbi:hypothetical protein I3842_03G158700 [Carya illinoinensis]|uniref:non-specific serine/threonine protein kinase n=1 Tax=Carya illinoinensis TaxID=32201 RepID=A0A922FGP0_CARIL|nr:hypothetical protein I3842_03G158700 [Carya illinoinensis]
MISKFSMFKITAKIPVPTPSYFLRKTVIRLLSYIFFFLYVYFLCSPAAYSEARDILKLGEQITDNGTTLISAGGKFELGFFTPMGSSSGMSFVGIWYHGWPNQTVVWVTNRDDPIPKGSTGVFGTDEDGSLRVSDTTGTGNAYWSTINRRAPSKNGYVKLMDSGNLVLTDVVNNGEVYLWESFEYPTDTFLPGMKMVEDLVLASWIGRDNPGTGIFKFKLQERDRYVVSKNSDEYWVSKSEFLGSDEMPDAIANLLSYSSHSDPLIQESRLVMDYSGQLQYWYSLSLVLGVPENNCSIYDACGKFGSCNINNRFVCKCLPGFKPSSPEDWKARDFSGGCTRNSTALGASDKFLSLKMMKVTDPDKTELVEDEEKCKTLCLNSSRCQAYSYAYNEDIKGRNVNTKNINLCSIWTEDVRNLQEEYTGNGRDLFVRVAESDIETAARNCEPCGTNMIPYPLSTSRNCGDTTYFSFYCNMSSGQFNPSLPFYVSDDGSGKSSSEAEDEVEISWAPPGEPSCFSSADCKDWPQSTCNPRGHGKRCLCNLNFRWDGSNLTCTKESDSALVQGASPKPSVEPSESKVKLLLIVVSTLACVIALTCIIIGIYLWRKKIAKTQANRGSNQRNRALHTLHSERHVKDLIDSGEIKEEDEGIDVPFFDLESIVAATDSFSDENKLGQGGYGPVYKGTFPGRQEIAVKRLSSVSGQGLQEFKNEVVLIAKLQHRNLVRLRGYCIKGEEKILLYEYMPNKSLDSFIFDQKLSVLLDWKIRFNIILGIARGLLYLHQDSRLRIIHRDLKTSNILLDEEMNPKISDFGLARIVGGKETGDNTTQVVGTYGYMSPEYALDGLFSVKSDVYSFGVVLLEIISGKKNTRFYQSEQAISLIGYAWRLWVGNTVLDLMDQTLHEVCNADQFVKCANIALLCVQDDANDRPTMSNVVTMLDSETATVPTPKKPAFLPTPRRDLSSTASSSSRLDTRTEVTGSLGETK